MDTQKDYINVRQVSELLGLKADTVRSLARQGKIPGVRLGKQWIFEKNALENSLNPDNQVL
ncbi:MAG: helix-turn-helix domain-containing protein [Caulobacteraceae bacterium]